MKLILITGGVRSGKSAFAEGLAQQMSQDSVLYVATGKAWDEEMQQRIDLHQQRRPECWRTWEEDLQLERLINEESLPQVVLLDTLSGWVTNLLFTYTEAEWGKKETRESILARIHSFVDELTSKHTIEDTTCIIVSDEVGLGGVAMTKLGRVFQDLIGSVNQYVAKHAAEVYFVVSGIPMKLRGGADT